MSLAAVSVFELALARQDEALCMCVCGGRRVSEWISLRVGIVVNALCGVVWCLGTLATAFLVLRDFPCFLVFHFLILLVWLMWRAWMVMAFMVPAIGGTGIRIRIDIGICMDTRGCAAKADVARPRTTGPWPMATGAARPLLELHTVLRTPAARALVIHSRPNITRQRASRTAASHAIRRRIAVRRDPALKKIWWHTSAVSEIGGLLGISLVSRQHSDKRTK